MTSVREDKAFRDHFFADNMFEDVVEWIRENLKPDDVFGDKSLKEWAEENGFVQPTD